MRARATGADSPFQKHYTGYLDLKRYLIKESLEYMKGLKDASTKIIPNGTV
jgi:hypothetical protein